jgi:hypothetical protein
MKYTVILQRPDYVTDDFGYDIYTAFVEGVTLWSAVHAARVEAIEADHEDINEFVEAGHKPDDYAVLAIFKGHIMAEFYPYDVG